MQNMHYFKIFIEDSIKKSGVPLPLSFSCRAYVIPLAPNSGHPAKFVTPVVQPFD